jgi:hypothetical protein
MLTFDRKEVFLPVVPIGATSSTVFHLVNNGYETMQVRRHFRLSVLSSFPACLFRIC